MAVSLRETCADEGVRPTRSIPVVEKRWKFCGAGGLTGFFAARYVCRVSRTVEYCLCVAVELCLFKAGSTRPGQRPGPTQTSLAGLNSRRSGGVLIRSLTTRLNVPVVRERIRAQVRSDLTRWATDLERKKTLRKGSTWSPAHRFERWSWQPTFYPSVGDQVSNESLILAQNQRWRRA